MQCWCCRPSPDQTPGDVDSVPSKLDFDAGASVEGLRVGYFPAWMNERPATEVDRAALDAVKKVGMVPVEVAIPDWPYGSLNLILFAEGAAAFEELGLNGGMNQLRKSRLRTRGLTFFVRPDFFPPSITCRPTGFAAKWRRRWRVSSRKSICFWCHRCATKCSPSPTSPDIHRLRCVQVLLRCRGRVAIGHRTPACPCQRSLPRAGCLTASP